jgi:glycosyltransferase involved in cell wall biosynthesis
LEDRASRPDLEGAVLFSGYVSPVWPALIRSDIVIAPALKEPFGNAVVEAQLARRPVVATKALGHTESIVNYKTGILVDPNDPHEMADAIAQLIDDPELARRLADAGRDNATRRFNVQRYRDEIYQLVSAASR